MATYLTDQDLAACVSCSVTPGQLKAWPSYIAAHTYWAAPIKGLEDPTSFEVLGSTSSDAGSDRT